MASNGEEVGSSCDVCWEVGLDGNHCGTRGGDQAPGNVEKSSGGIWLQDSSGRGGGGDLSWGGKIVPVDLLALDIDDEPFPTLNDNLMEVNSEVFMESIT